MALYVRKNSPCAQPARITIVHIFKTLFPTFLLNLMSFKLMCLSGCNSQISCLGRTEVCIVSALPRFQEIISFVSGWVWGLVVWGFLLFFFLNKQNTHTPNK